MSDSSTKGDQTRAEILDAAWRLFLEQGYHGTSMRDIARAAGGRAVAGLYNHFATKETIFEALFIERNPYEELFGALERDLEGITAAPEFVHTALQSVLRVMTKHYDFFQLAQIDVREFGGRHISQLLQEVGFPRIVLLVARLQSLPGLRPLEPVVWMRLMACMILGYIITDKVAPQTMFGQFNQDEWASLFANALLYGIASDQGEDER
ncbi:MAG: TetR/AcrR family transcriptional regulator [Chloroflexi bacterium]|nr:TetR/AcrR family transcriptional regulator [Chloroflexota bacterium]